MKKILFVMLGALDDNSPADECPLCNTVASRIELGLYSHFCAIAGKQVFWV